MIIMMILLNESGVGDDEVNAQHCDDSQVVVIVMVMVRMMWIMVMLMVVRMAN